MRAYSRQRARKLIDAYISQVDRRPGVLLAYISRTAVLNAVPASCTPMNVGNDKPYTSLRFLTSQKRLLR